MTNESIIKNASLTTGGVTHGLLNSEQARTFIKQTFEQTALGPLVRKQMRKAKTGEIDKIGIASRVVRRKVENIDAQADGSAPILDPATGQITGYRAKPTFGSVPYATKAVRLPWEISEETLRENIEGQALEATITNLMTTQLGLDMEDLYLNGDTTTPSSDSDHLFLSINDGWVKKVETGGHIYDASGHSSMNIDMFYKAVAAMPNKYNNGKLRWLMSPRRAQEWERFLLNQGLNAGGSYPERLYREPVSIKAVDVPSMPDDKILLVDPQNLIVVNTYDVKIRKTDQGERAIMEDKRFYVIHLDFDSIIEELDASAIITNVPG